LQYVPLEVANAAAIRQVKLFADDLAEYLEAFGTPSRELSLSVTKLEEAVFWATKHFSAPERQS
jgi:hypothetical protein